MSNDERFGFLSRVQALCLDTGRQTKQSLPTVLHDSTRQHCRHLIAHLNSPGGPLNRNHQCCWTYGLDAKRAIVVTAGTLDWFCSERRTPMLAEMAQHLARFDEPEISAGMKAH